MKAKWAKMGIYKVKNNLSFIIYYWFMHMKLSVYTLTHSSASVCIYVCFMFYVLFTFLFLIP